MEVRENGKFRLIFKPVPNVPNYLECFDRMQNLYSRIPNILRKRLALRSLKCTNSWQSNDHFLKESQGNIKFQNLKKRKKVKVKEK